MVSWLMSNKNVWRKVYNVITTNILICLNVWCVREDNLVDIVLFNQSARQARCWLLGCLRGENHAVGDACWQNGETSMSLEWSHMNIKSSQITGKSTVCSIVCSAHCKENSTAPRHWLSWGNSTGDPVISPHKGPSGAENDTISWSHHVRWQLEHG